MLFLAVILKINQGVLLWPDHICSVCPCELEKQNVYVDMCLCIVKKDDLLQFIR